MCVCSLDLFVFVPLPNVVTANRAPFSVFHDSCLFNWPMEDGLLSLACYCCQGPGSDPDNSGKCSALGRGEKPHLTHWGQDGWEEDEDKTPRVAYGLGGVMTTKVWTPGDAGGFGRGKGILEAEVTQHHLST